MSSQIPENTNQIKVQDMSSQIPENVLHIMTTT